MSFSINTMGEYVLDLQLPYKIGQIFCDDPADIPTRYRAAYGGRGSGKSFGFADMLLSRTMQEPTRALCTRELQTSIKESVLQTLIDRIEFHGLHQFYDSGESYLKSLLWGEDFVFRGLRHNYQEIKSMQGIRICWIEEAETTSEASLRVLDPTLRSGSELWFTWNPENSDSPVNVRYVKNPPQNAKVVKVNHSDNPWFPEELEILRLQDQKRDPDVYAHVWEGECLTRTDAQVLGGKWRVDSFNMPAAEEIDDGPYYGCDWGFSSDPLALVRCWIKGKRLYIDQEAGGARIEIKDTPAAFDKIPGIKTHMIRADNARPEMISNMQIEGYRCVAAEKWPGSVEDGITHLRSYDEIIIHERCIEVAREARLWSYKIDKKSGDVLPLLVDAFNHYFDAIRYALAPLIKKKNFTGKAVYAGQYNEILHISREELWPVIGLPIIVGLAFQQTTTCAVFAQVARNGQVRVIEEIVERNMGVSQFALTTLKPLIANKYRGCPRTFVSFRDRTSSGRTIDSESRLLLDEMEEQGLSVESVSSDLLSRRMESVRWFFGQLAGGRPAISISPACRVIHDGLGGGYQFRQLQIQGGDDIRYSPEPEENQYVLPHLALQYICMWLRDEHEGNKTKPVISGLRTY